MRSEAVRMFVYLELMDLIGFVWLVGFNDISSLVGYIMPNQFYTNKQFYFKRCILE